MMPSLITSSLNESVSGLERFCKILEDDVERKGESRGGHTLTEGNYLLAPALDADFRMMCVMV